MKTCLIVQVLHVCINVFYRLPNKAHSLNVQDKWHTAYYGTRMDLLRRIVDSGDLHVSGKLSLRS